ncbi:transcription factor Adf-1-like [Macrobrachium rosenbergii]|uniref:transcription factor Adf-1-like n=1 Tax=Macrobrachium rosenbergii TaxID=79674 RepID=UPI0034D69956
MLVELLINLVRERPAIYDASDPNHSDRGFVVSLWKEVAAAMSCTEAECKDKWRHLRSNFMRERRKISEKPSGSGNTLTKRWLHYDSMEFLIPHVTPRPTSSNVPTPPDEDTGHEMEDTDIDSSFADFEAPFISPPQMTTSNAETCEDRSNGKSILPNSKKPRVSTKRSKVSADDMDVYFLDELRRLRVQSSSENANSNDGDRHFLLSLLPLMEQLSPIDNLDIRIEIYEVFRKKMFKPASSVQNGYWTEQNQSRRPTPSPSPSTISHSSDN